jgi:hypothetical protein
MVALKNNVDSKTEAFINMEKKQSNVNKVKNYKSDLEQAEVLYYEANLSYNIMLIHLAYDTIEKFK